MSVEMLVVTGCPSTKTHHDETVAVPAASFVTTASNNVVDEVVMPGRGVSKWTVGLPWTLERLSVLVVDRPEVSDTVSSRVWLPFAQEVASNVNEP